VKKPFSKLFNLIDKSETRSDDDSLVTVSVEHIVPNQYQPRTVFNHQRIEELAHSIKAHGLLQPITLRPIEEGMYEIIAGERRFRALKHLGYEDTQAIVKYLTDQESAAIALIENISGKTYRVSKKRELINSCSQWMILHRKILRRVSGKASLLSPINCGF
jgi:ParB-like partition proteins